MSCATVLIAVLAVVAALPAPGEWRPGLHATSVGRFGAGHEVTARSADRDLLAWSLVNADRGMDVGLHNQSGERVSLGVCGLPGEAPVTRSVRDIGWTQLTARFETGQSRLDVLESLLTPVLWLRADAGGVELFRGTAGAAVAAVALPSESGAEVLRPGEAAALRTEGAGLSKPWFMVLVDAGGCRYPVVCLLDRKPVHLDWGADRVRVVWPEGPGECRVGLLPLFGCRPAGPEQTQGWEGAIPPDVVARTDRLAHLFLYVPVGVREEYRLLDGSVEVANAFAYDGFEDEWGWKASGEPFAPVPAALAAAAAYGYPVDFSGPVTDIDYPTFLGPTVVRTGAKSVTFSLPMPDVHGTINSPMYSEALAAFLPDEIVRTVQDYQSHVRDVFDGDGPWGFPQSPVGDARYMVANYECYPMMDEQTREVFDAWADRVSREKLYNWDLYSDRTEAANGRRFLLDDYRFEGRDFMDAGWFGYDPMAMWSRAYYSGDWDDVLTHWPRIRELFYGWTWTYTDYVSMYSPLTFEGANGGGSKGYGDNMCMLGAHYAWARMAEQVGDRDTLSDALYMLAREIAARYARMTVYAHARDCGYETDVVYLVSDMGNGPNIARTGRFIPPDSSQWQRGALVDYGPYAGGLWFFTGSFCEPVTSETIALIAHEPMRGHVGSDLALLDRRYPRWYAAPSSGEEANYQIYMRGALFHEDPVRLRYYFDYQDGFGTGKWRAAAWHANSHAGIVLSSYYGLESRGQYRLRLRRDGGDEPASGAVEMNVLRATGGRTVLAFLNNSGAPVEAVLSLVGARLGLPEEAGLLDVEAGEFARHDADGQYALKLKVGVSGYLATVRADDPTPFVDRGQPGLKLTGPRHVVAVTSSEEELAFVLANDGDVAQTVRVSADGLELGEAGERMLRLEPGEAAEIEAIYRAPAECVAPRELALQVEAGETRLVEHVTALVLPAVTGILSADVERVAWLPQLGRASLKLLSRAAAEDPVRVRWSLNGSVVEERSEVLAAASTRTVELVLNAEDVPPGRYRLEVSAGGSLLEPVRRAMDVLVADPTPGDVVVAYSFEDGAQGWRQADWPNGNRSPDGDVYSPTSAEGPASDGASSLLVPVNLAAGRQSQALTGVFPRADWSRFGSVEVDVYLPPDAPEGLWGRLYMMGAGWKWCELRSDAPLSPGEWRTLRADFAGPAVQDAWGMSDAEMSAALDGVIEFGVKVHNGLLGRSGYRGRFLLDNVRLRVRGD